MKTSSLNCICQNFIPPHYDDRILAIEQLRNQCPALKLLLIPDLIWDNYKTAELAPRDNGLHIFVTSQSILEGDIGKLTSSLHRYLYSRSQTPRLPNAVGQVFGNVMQLKLRFTNCHCNEM